MEKKRVLVAMSGGVDSSAAALLLQQQGYACDGAMLKLYSGEVEGTCCSADDADDARSVAYRLGMKFYVFNETERFARDVMDHFVAEYCAGHTPNPCIDCNRCLKFGALLERALVLGYDYLATGHYARVGYDPETGLYQLLRGRDRRKDQSYVLYQLTQHQLSHLLLPVGEFDKPAIRESAREAGLLNALYDAGLTMNDVNPDYVVVGEGRTYSLDTLTKAVNLVMAGAKLIGANSDVSGPIENGIAPACRALVAPIEMATGTQAYFCGKPNPLMMRTGLRMLNCHSADAVMVGDRMDTDVISGMESGMSTVLVLSGVSTMDTLKTYAYRPTAVLSGVGEIVERARQTAGV